MERLPGQSFGGRPGIVPKPTKLGETIQCQVGEVKLGLGVVSRCVEERSGLGYTFGVLGVSVP